MGKVHGDGRFCFGHDPDLQERRTHGRQRGGENRATAKRLDRLLPASLKPTIALLFTVLEEVHTGALTPAQGTAIAALAGAIARLYQAGIVEERLAALEATTAPSDRKDVRWTS
jgi:TRAP-type mannitol/chloroaromatic compound transport system permease large subunit